MSTVLGRTGETRGWGWGFYKVASYLWDLDATLLDPQFLRVDFRV